MSHTRPAILQIVPSLDTGGAERATIDVAAALAREGYPALVATRGGRMLPELIRTGAEWIRMPVHSRAPFTILANAFRLAGLIRSRNIALVHARSRAPAWSAFAAARLASVPFVTTYHGIYNAGSAPKRFYNSVMARGDAVIANSQWTASHISAAYDFRPKRLAVIPRGVDLSRFDPRAVSRERIADVRKRWGVSDMDTVILLPGRLTRWKGHGVLIEALGRLKEVGIVNGVRAVFAGDSQGRSGYEAELRKRIAALGLEPHIVIAGHEDDMAAAYLGADIVVSASTDPEAFGRVAAEAGAMGRPVIATDHGGAREVVLPGRSGMLLPPGDPAALARALQDLLVIGREGRAALGEAARMYISQRFTAERMCAETLGLYRSLIAERDDSRLSHLLA